MAVTWPFRLFCTAHGRERMVWRLVEVPMARHTLVQRERTNWTANCRGFELPGRCRARSEGTNDGGRYTGGVAHLRRQLW